MSKEEILIAGRKGNPNDHAMLQRKAMQRRWLNQLIRAVIPKPKRPSLRALMTASTRYCR